MAQIPGPVPLRAVDDTDRAILQLLRRDGRATNAEIGRATDLTEGAVRHRIAQLRADGTILRFTAVTAPLGPEGLVLVRCRPDRTGEILRAVRARATDVFETSGEYDLGAFVECATIEELNRTLDAIRSIEGVDSTLTLIRLSRWSTPDARTARPARSRPRGTRAKSPR
ncbi:AsnC family transcriptional regulator [mine drainage metagenome]|uniref:AsnC family transcriptional regulator n=1 Tax=mine drainage metagenome TaxID=410659 RepID=T0ZSA6_9ZZZZ